MIATAQVSSAALYPFLAGDVRVALPTAEFFIHPISATLSGKYTAAQLRTEISDLEGDAERTRRIVTERTSITAARWNKMSAIDTTLAIPEALKCGILHGTAGYTKKTIKKP
jgi:ATP-dependent protease ClpP protease subunit